MHARVLGSLWVLALVVPACAVAEEVDRYNRVSFGVESHRDVEND